MLSPINELGFTDENQEKINSIEPKTSDNIDENQRSIIVNESQPLARYSVLYLGTAVPSIDQQGIDSIQEPISKRYPVDGSEIVRGIEAWLSIDDNGLQIQFASDPSVVLYYPIRALIYCASVRLVTRTETGDKYPDGWRFIPLDFPDANLTENAQNPPLFTITFHRTRYQLMNECHCFITKTKQIATTLVQACSNAYHATDSEQDCSKVPLYFKIINNGLQMKEIDDEISVVPAVNDELISDCLMNNKASGFFYKTNVVPIEFWKLWENPKHSLRRSSSTHSINSSRHRRLSSIQPIPETEKPSEEIQTTNNRVVPSPQLMIDPYAPDPNVIHVQCIKDIQTGRDIFIRWIRNPSEQKSKIRTPDYDFHIDFSTDYQYEQELPKQIEHLVLDDKSQLKKSKSKENHVSVLPIIQQEFPLPSFETIYSNNQSFSVPKEFFSM